MDIKATLSRIPPIGWIAGGGLALGLVLLIRNSNSGGGTLPGLGQTSDVTDALGGLSQALRDWQTQGGGGGGTTPNPNPGANPSGPGNPVNPGGPSRPYPPPVKTIQGTPSLQDNPLTAIVEVFKGGRPTTYYDSRGDRVNADGSPYVVTPRDISAGGTLVTTSREISTGSFGVTQQPISSAGSIVESTPPTSRLIGGVTVSRPPSPTRTTTTYVRR